MTRHHSPPHGPDPEDEPTVPTVHDLGFRPAVSRTVQVRVLAIVVLTLVLCGLALWMLLGEQEHRLRVEDPGASEEDRD